MLRLCTGPVPLTSCVYVDAPQCDSLEIVYNLVEFLHKHPIILQNYAYTNAQEVLSQRHSQSRSFCNLPLTSKTPFPTGRSNKLLSNGQSCKEQHAAFLR